MTTPTNDNWLKCARRIAELRAKYDRQAYALWAEYHRQADPLRAEYARLSATSQPDQTGQKE